MLHKHLPPQDVCDAPSPLPWVLDPLSPHTTRIASVWHCKRKQSDKTPVAVAEVVTHRAPSDLPVRSTRASTLSTTLLLMSSQAECEHTLQMTGLKTRPNAGKARLSLLTVVLLVLFPAVGVATSASDGSSPVSSSFSPWSGPSRTPSSLRSSRPLYRFSDREQSPSILETTPRSHSPCPKGASLGAARKSHPSTGPFPHPPLNRPRFSTNRPHAPFDNIESNSNYNNDDDSLSSVNMPPQVVHEHPRHHQQQGPHPHTGPNRVAQALPDPKIVKADKPPANPKIMKRASGQRFPAPIVYQYTMYYPGNIPLIITAGHGGSDTPGKTVPARHRLTHKFKRIPDLKNAAGPIEVSAFSEPFTGSGPDVNMMPSMPERDQSGGGSFKRDLNTHSIALNLANAVTCITSDKSGMRRRAMDRRGVEQKDRVGTMLQGGIMGDQTVNGTRPMGAIAADSAPSFARIPQKCKAQGPWGDNESDEDPDKDPDSTPAPSLPPPPPGPGQYYPHVVVFRVPRLYVDVNRNLVGENAIAVGNPVSEAAWREYHDVIDHVQRMVTLQRLVGKPNLPDGAGLLLDIHGMYRHPMRVVGRCP